MTRRPLAIAAALVALAIATAVSCGVPIDDQPRAISRSTAPPETAVPTTLDGSPTDQVSVYFLRGEALERYSQAVTEEPTIGQAIGFVLDPLPTEADPGLRTAVPPGTSLRAVDVAGRVATVDLTSEINDVAGKAQKEAFAQIVFTTLAWEGVEQVRFQVDGELAGVFRSITLGAVPQAIEVFAPEEEVKPTPISKLRWVSGFFDVRI